MSDFIKAALIRAIRTMAQTATATIGTALVIYAVDWQTVVSASVLSGILSILTSIATGLPEVHYPQEMTDEEATAIEDQKAEYEQILAEDVEIDEDDVDEESSQEDDDEVEL